MPWAFSDGFDCYTNSADMALNYWDTCNTGQAFPAGRFSGGRAVQISGGGPNFVKSSGANESVHHINIAAYFLQNLGALTQVQNYIQLLDGTTPQCTIAFLNNGSIALLSGGTGGAVLATFPGALVTVTTWYAFEIEVVVHNSTGSFKVRKNGSSTDDHSTTGIDTAGGTANNFANKIAFGLVNGSPIMYLDDFYWRSDISAVPWWSDIRCNTRPPASDASVQFSRAPATMSQITGSGMGAGSVSQIANQIQYVPFTAAYTGSVGSLTVTCSTTSTANFKCALYNNAGSGGSPGLVLGTATPFSAPGVGTYTINFPTPIAVTAGSVYWVGIGGDAASGQFRMNAVSALYYFAGSSYAAFPVNNPAVTTTSGQTWYFTVNYTPSSNYMMVSEAQQDAAATYVYDTIPGHADFYGIAPITSTPMQTFAVTTRALAIKSDAGTRTMAVQLKSGASTVVSPTVVLSPSAWQWVWRTDATDPAGGAWTAAAVNAAQIGPLVVA